MSEISWAHALWFGVGLVAGYYVVAHYRKTGSAY
jgi:hypothetical protein